MKSQHVLILGGGLIGLCSAYALVRDGHTVTIIERETLGSGAAQGNAGEVTPLQVTPLASPSMVKDITTGVFSRSAYLSIALGKLPWLAGFGIGFLRKSTRSAQARSTAALQQFSDGMFPSFDAMADAGIDIGGGGEGFLFTSSVPGEIEGMHAGCLARSSPERGDAPGPILRGDELHQLEPSLHPSVTAGFLAPKERFLTPSRFVASLISWLTERGVEVREGTEAVRLTTVAGKPGALVRGADGNTETVSADAVVVTAGARSPELAKRSGTHLSGAAGKGYSFTVPVKTLPKYVVHAIDRHCVLTPMDGQLRVVGMMEFDGRPETLNADRIDFLRDSAAGVVANADWAGRTNEWVGPRPMTPDGMPALGPLPGFPRTFVATGHNMHGLSLGPVTGDVIADLVAERTPRSNGAPVDLAPFAPGRMHRFIG